MASLLHIGHARNEIEFLLTVVGFAITLLGVGVAVMSLWPRRAPGMRAEREDSVVRRRRLRAEDEELLDEDVDGGTELGAFGEDGVDLVLLERRD